jgi:outer membrane immunogenic protein
MKKILLSTVAMGSVIAASSTFAADLPSRKALPTLASQSLWQGAYAGINAGYGVNNINNYSNKTGFYPIDNITSGDFNSTAGYIAGGLAGAQLGYNHVFANRIMAGAEIDLDWADVYNNTLSNTGKEESFLTDRQRHTLYLSSPKSATWNSSYYRTGLDWIGTARARIGYDLGRFLPYITGGLAYGGLSQSRNLNDVSVSYWSTICGNSSAVSVGWAAGAGAEYMVADNWSVKGEYLFTSIGGISTPVQIVEGDNTQGTTKLASQTDYTGSFGVHQIRVGLNYHPNWWGAAPIVGDYRITSSSPLTGVLPSHKSAPFLASTSLWKGAYAGVNAGYGVNNINNYSNKTGFNPIGNYTTGNFTSTVGYIAGGLAGAQLGYNHVFANRIMVGTEIDLDWADIYNNASPDQGQTLIISSNQTASSDSSYQRAGLDWIGTARARIGYDLGRFLPYITGGLAYGGLSQSNNYDFVSQSTWSNRRGNSSTVSVGWAAGAGAEYMVADNWSVKGEYLFASINGISTPIESVDGNKTRGTTYLASQTDYTGSFGVHQIRVGLNYHPNWWGAAPIIGDYGIASSSPLTGVLPSHKSAPFLASTSLWKGVYAGINTGYGVNNINNYSNRTTFSPIANIIRGTFRSSADYIAGGLAGAQLGYNHVFANHIMAGAEIDLDWADIYNNARLDNTQRISISSAESAFSNSSYYRTGLDWIGTARARIGYELGHFLPYITGGLAYGGLSLSNNFDSVSESSWFTTRGNSSNVSIGWVAGAGNEYMVADNWSVKTEYLFTSIGGISTPVQSVSGSNSQGITYLDSVTYHTGSFGVHQVRAGLNYHPNWWGAAPVISAY